VRVLLLVVVLPQNTVGERRKEEKGLHILVCPGNWNNLSLSLSLCDDFFNEQRFCDDAKRANFDAHEYENQQKENHLFCRKHEKRKDEKRFVFFVFVTFTTLFSHNKEGV